MRFYLDANMTDGTNPDLVDRVYPDGRRVPQSQPEPDDVLQARAAYVTLRDFDIDAITSLAQAKPLLKLLRAAVIFLAKREMEDMQNG